MFPLRDNVESQTIPVVTWSIMIANACAFVAELLLGPNYLESFMRVFGLVPAEFLQHFGPIQICIAVLSMFLHAGWAHLIGNMWFLFIFGDNVEDRMGHLKYLFFYLFTGLCATITQVLINPHSQVAMVGASGAISGVLGAYLIFYRQATVVTLVPFGFFSRLVEIPAIFFLGFWFVMELFTGFFSLGSVDPNVGGVAFWAHVGGFVAGAFTAQLFAADKK